MKRLTALAVLAAHVALVACSSRGTDLAAPRSSASAPSAVLGPADGELMMNNLMSPRGMAWGPDSALYVAEAGIGGPRTAGPCFTQFGQIFCYGATGAVSRLREGVQERVVDDLPSYAANSGRAEGPNGISMHGNGDAYVTIGLEANPIPLRAAAPEWSQFGRLVRLSPSALAQGKGKGHSAADWEFVEDLAQYEIDANPDCGDINSNPFGVLVDRGGVLVTDAGANAIVRRSANGELSTVAAFSYSLTVPGPGCPPAAAHDFVPTGIITGPDRAYYFGHLNGLPIIAGSSSVWRMEPDGTPTVYQSGFTWIVGLAFDPTGNLYVLQYSLGPLQSAPGSLVRVAPDGTRETIAANLPRPGGVITDQEGRVYVTIIPGANFRAPGQVRRYTP